MYIKNMIFFRQPIVSMESKSVQSKHINKL